MNHILVLIFTASLSVGQEAPHPTPIPFVIDGLLPRAAFSVLGAKPKHGKSSFARIEAVCTSKGTPFLDRPTHQGEVLLCSLEDSRQHVDNHLQLLGYNPHRDARIYIVSRLSHDVSETIDALAKALATRPHINLVILDTLAKTVRAKDSNDYDEMLRLCEQLRALAREPATESVSGRTHRHPALPCGVPSAVSRRDR